MRDSDGRVAWDQCYNPQTDLKVVLVGADFHRDRYLFLSPE